MTRLVRIGLLFLVPIVAGCDSLAISYIGVSGRVTYRGKPLPRGTIVFRADHQLGGRSSAVAEILDGWYSLSRTDGPSEGTFAVEIRGVDPMPGAIPARYNRETELEVVLAKRRSIELMFDLE